MADMDPGGDDGEDGGGSSGGGDGNWFSNFSDGEYWRKGFIGMWKSFTKWFSSAMSNLGAIFLFFAVVSELWVFSGCRQHWAPCFRSYTRDLQSPIP